MGGVLFIFFFFSHFGEEQLIPGECSQQRRGALLLQVEVFMLNICEQSRALSSPSSGTF